MRILYGIPKEGSASSAAGEASATADLQQDDSALDRRLDRGMPLRRHHRRGGRARGAGGFVLVGGLLAGAVAGGGLGGSISLGVPDDRVADYTGDLTDGRYLIVAHGSADEVAIAGEVLGMTDTEQLDVFV